ncbi:hypothetical protein L7F22_026730 [Adiantum nelumboides]|nr:hypothetical protein [Adiantum nelumboides]
MIDLNHCELLSPSRSDSDHILLSSKLHDLKKRRANSQINDDIAVADRIQKRKLDNTERCVLEVVSGITERASTPPLCLDDDRGLQISCDPVNDGGTVEVDSIESRIKEIMSRTQCSHRWGIEHEYLTEPFPIIRRLWKLTSMVRRAFKCLEKGGTVQDAQSICSVDSLTSFSVNEGALQEFGVSQFLPAVNRQKEFKGYTTVTDCDVVLFLIHQEFTKCTLDSRDGVDVRIQMGRVKRPESQFVEQLKAQKKGQFTCKCKFCGRTWDRDPYRIRAHLLSLSGHGVGPCESVPKNVKEVVTRLHVDAKSDGKDPNAYVDGLVDDLGGNASLSQGGASGSMSTHASGNAHVSASGISASKSNVGSSSKKRKGAQGPLASAFSWQARKQADQALRRFFYAEDIPEWKVQSPFFLEMVKAIGQVGPSYVPPTYNALRTTELNDEIKERGYERIEVTLEMLNKKKDEERLLELQEIQEAIAQSTNDVLESLPISMARDVGTSCSVAEDEAWDEDEDEDDDEDVAFDES